MRGVSYGNSRFPHPLPCSAISPGHETSADAKREFPLASTPECTSHQTEASHKTSRTAPREQHLTLTGTYDSAKAQQLRSPSPLVFLFYSIPFQGGSLPMITGAMIVHSSNPIHLSMTNPQGGEMTNPQGSSVAAGRRVTIAQPNH